MTPFPEPFLRACPGSTSLDEERRELLASVLGALARHPPDPDQMAACSHILKHLAQTAGRLPPGHQPRPMLAMMDC